VDNSRSQFTMKLLVTGTTHPISLREKLTFLHSAAFCTLGSKQPFAAGSSNDLYADLAAVCCTLHHSLVLTICDFGYDAWQAEISN